jgi:ABC-type tungstate transport system permease subunit
MIVEQDIGRVPRLASEHAQVIIFNIMLQGTFEEYIVDRLMEKLQVLAQGTSRALDTARPGDADVVFVHSRAAEENFVSEGFGVKRYPVIRILC